MQYLKGDFFNRKIGGDLIQHTLAPNVPATVAPFRAWRDLQIIVTRGPKQVTIEERECIAKAGAVSRRDFRDSLVLAPN